MARTGKTSPRAMRTATPRPYHPAAASARGIDVTKHYQDIMRIAYAYFREPSTVDHFRKAAHAGHAGRLMDREDFCQEVALAVHRKNGTGGAYDPSRGSVGKFIWQVCFSVASHATERLDMVEPNGDAVDSAQVSESTGRLDAGVRVALEHHGASLTSLARASEKDSKKGQLRLFSVRDEHPSLADIVDALAA